jgi:hypothetical protein
MKHSAEYNKFTNLVDNLLTVSHEEIQRREAEYRTKTRLKEKAESSYAAFRFRPRGNRNLEYRLRFFVLLRRQFRIGQSLANDLRTQTAHSFAIINGIRFRPAIVVPENLFVNIAEEMERLNRNISTVQSALQQTPEILNSVDVNATANISLGLVHHLMHESPLQPLLVCDRASV